MLIRPRGVQGKDSIVDSLCDSAARQRIALAAGRKFACCINLPPTLVAASQYGGVVRVESGNSAIARIFGGKTQLGRAFGTGKRAVVSRIGLFENIEARVASGNYIFFTGGIRLGCAASAKHCNQGDRYPIPLRDKHRDLRFTRY